MPSEAVVVLTSVAGVPLVTGTQVPRLEAVAAGTYLIAATVTPARPAPATSVTLPLTVLAAVSAASMPVAGVSKVAVTGVASVREVLSL
ncbi:unannotated protein [freshwater metagenome]|uniref:Unannotated protein n=1 Tax=freshwater metagenome TaxID=449393 RepID=A0A6J6R2Q9_9ZZZZ